MAGSKWTVRAVAIVGIVSVLLIFLVITVGVIARWVAGGIRGTIDICEYLLAGVAFLGLGYALLVGMHVRVDSVISRFPQKLKGAVEIFNLLLSMAVIFLFTWLVAKTGYTSWLLGERYYGTLPVPEWIRFLIAVIGCSGFILALLIQLFRRLTGSAEGGN